jgi:sulfur relay protein TusB/DsrH
MTVVKLAKKMSEGGFAVVILLARAAANFAANPKIMGSLNFAEGVYVLQVDRGLRGSAGETAGRVKSVDYDGFLELLENCEKIISWS